MKRWWSNVVRDYFTFSKKERQAVIITVVFIVTALLLLPRFYKRPAEHINQEALIKQLAQLKIQVDSSSARKSWQRADDENFTWYEPKKNYGEPDSKGEMFEFDPNTLSEAGWKRLGVRDKTVQTIQHFLAKGYKFRKPEDIKKIYGLKAEQADRLMPYVKISSEQTEKQFASYDNPAIVTPVVSKKPVLRIIDINEADTSAFIMLNGIGSKLAARIVNFRDKLGGFASVNQLGETYGLPDSTFQKIKPQLVCNHPALKTININSAAAAQLKHPYLSWNIANAIVRYREQHGKYAAVNDVLKIDIIDEATFNKIAPYLVVE